MAMCAMCSMELYFSVREWGNAKVISGSIIKKKRMKLHKWRELLGCYGKRLYCSVKMWREAKKEGCYLCV